MNRLVAVLVFGMLVGLVNVASACHRCRHTPCASTCQIACPTYCAPVCQTNYRTTYVNVVKCVRVTYCKRVKYKDCRGCCRTKLVRCTKLVKRCVRVPVTTCTTVCSQPSYAPSYEPCADPCDPCADGGRVRLCDRIRAHFCRR